MGYKLEDVFVASPYSNLYNLGGKLSEEVFSSALFVESTEYDSIYIEMCEILDNIKRQKPCSIFLHGYAGIGKTTYLRWFFKEYAETRSMKSNHVYFDFTGTSTITEDNVEEHSGIDLFANYFATFLKQYRDGNYATLKKLFDYMQEKLLDDTNLFPPTFSLIVKDIFDADYKINKNKYNDLIHESKCSHLFLMILMLYNIDCESIITQCKGYKDNFNKSKDLVVVIDNIDSINMNQASVSAFKMILSNYQKYKLLIADSSFFTTEHIVTFVFCMRDSTYAFVNPHDKDFHDIHRINFSKAIPDANAIIGKRVLYSALNDIVCAESAKKFLHAISDDHYYNSRYLPVFNYNTRKFSTFLISYAEKNKNKDLVRAVLDLYSSSADSVEGKRGFVYYMMIERMSDDDIFGSQSIYEDGELTSLHNHTLINPARLILTAVTNKTKYCQEDPQNATNIKTVYLNEIYNDFCKVFKGRLGLFTRTIETLFYSFKKNWCHLILLERADVASKKTLPIEVFLKRLRNNNIADPEEYLSNYKVRATPAAYFFLRDIIRHYEYHSFKSENKTPLFYYASNTRDSCQHDLAQIKKNINNTKSRAIDCINSLKAFLDSYSSEKFVSSALCFRINATLEYGSDDQLHDRDKLESNINSRACNLLINRIIDTHTNYLDVFRRFMINRIHEDKDTRLRSHCLSLNSFICKTIIDYITLYEHDIEGRYQKIQDTQLENLTKIEKAKSISEWSYSLQYKR